MCVHVHDKDTSFSIIIKNQNNNLGVLDVFSLLRPNQKLWFYLIGLEALSLHAVFPESQDTVLKAHCYNRERGGRVSA